MEQCVDKIVGELKVGIEPDGKLDIRYEAAIDWIMSTAAAAAPVARDLNPASP